MKSYRALLTLLFVAVVGISVPVKAVGFFDKVKQALAPYKKVEVADQQGKIDGIDNEVKAKKAEADKGGFSKSVAYQKARIQGDFNKFAVKNHVGANFAMYSGYTAATVGVIGAVTGIGYAIFKLIQKIRNKNKKVAPVVQEPVVTEPEVKNETVEDLIKAAHKLVGSSTDEKLSGQVLTDNRWFQSLSDADKACARYLLSQFDFARTVVCDDALAKEAADMLADMRNYPVKK